jgi:hypothetical protein
MENMGLPHWSLTLCLLLAWIMVAACIIQGIKSSGKVNIKSISKRGDWVDVFFLGCLFYFIISVCGHFCVDHSRCYFTRLGEMIERNFDELIVE